MGHKGLMVRTKKARPNYRGFVREIIRDLKREEEKVVQPFLDFLNADLEKEDWRDVTESLMQRIAPDAASDPKRWFAKPELYNSNGSKEVQKETVLKLQSLWRDYLERLLKLSLAQDPPLLAGLMWGLASQDIAYLYSDYAEEVRQPSNWRTGPDGLPKKIDLYCLVLGLLLVEGDLVTGGLYGRCPECGKLFFKQRRDMLYCGVRCRVRRFRHM